MPAKIKVSSICYNEIAEALQKAGQTINQQGALTIEKDATINQPHDLRLASIRRDCLFEAVKISSELIKTEKYEGKVDPIEIANAMFEWVLKGKEE